MQGLEIGNVGTFCAGDPPIVVALPTSQQILEFVIGGNIGSYLNVNTFLQNLTKTYLWYGLCECSDLTTPALPTPPANTGVPALNPSPYVSLPLNTTPCATVSGADGRVLPVGGGYGSVDLVGSGACTGGYIGDGYLVPAGATFVRATFKNTVAGVGPTDSFKFNVNFASGTKFGVAGVGATVGLLQQTVVSGATVVVDAAVPATTDRVYCCNTFSANPNTTNISSVTLAFYCGAPIGVVPQPCCPPDPLVAGQLNQLLGLVTLIQRQSVPFSYVASTAHPGITNTGTIAVQGLIGVKITVTAYPAANKVIPGEPSYVYDLGWVSIETPDGFIDEVRIRNPNQLWQPRMMGEATKLGYYLRAGVTATFTELVREA